MKDSPLVAQIITLGLLAAFIGSAWLIADVGVKESFDVITNDSGNTSNQTIVTFGGDVGFGDRIFMVGSWVTLLTGVGALTISSRNPKVANTILRTYPLILGAIGAIEFGDTVSDMVSGTYDFDANTDGQNALALTATGSVIGGAAAAVGINKKL
jgi:hypothetical protein